MPLPIGSIADLFRGFFFGSYMVIQKVTIMEPVGRPEPCALESRAQPKVLHKFRSAVEAAGSAKPCDPRAPGNSGHGNRKSRAPKNSGCTV